MKRRLLPFVAIAFALALVGLVGRADPAAAATTFTPELKVTLATSVPESTNDFTVDFGIPQGDVNFAGVVSFVPSAWGIVTGDTINVGTDVGSLSSTATLGLINAPCNTSLPVSFQFKNSTIDTKDTVSFDDKDGNGTADYAEDKNHDGNFDAIDHYPSFLNNLFKGLQPVRRSAGVTPVAGIPILLQFLVFAPGTHINDLVPDDAALGYPSVTVLQNIGDTEAIPAPSPITDFCSPLTSTNVTLGKSPDGKLLFISPKSGTYSFSTFGVGLSDADGDSYENSLDTCAYDVNKGNPRIPGDGDADQDGLDAACDPNDNETNSDQDGDGYLNRQDNCPLVSNGQPLDPKATTEPGGNQADKDLDQIGDKCDKDSSKVDGDRPTAEPKVDVKIGDGAGAGGPPDKCTDPNTHCWNKDWKFVKQAAPSGTAASASAPASGTTKPSGSVSASGTAGGATKDDGGSDTGLIIGIVVGVIAAVVIIGGGAAYMMRRRGS